MNNWYKRAIYIEAQTLEDFFNGNVNDIIQNNILRNPKSKEWDEQRFNEVFLEISFKSLRKAIRKELNIIISEIPKDIEGMNELVIYLINNKDNILNNEKIQTKKTFKDVDELSSYISDSKEIYLSPEDENILRIELQNGNNYLDEWIKFSIYDSRENPQDVDLSYIRDWLHYYTNQYNTIPKVNQQKAIELSRSWHEELLKHEVTNYSDEELREKPNKGQKGDKVQRIQLDSIMKDSMNKLPNNIQESISQLEKDGIYVIELNSAKDLVLEGKRMQHCVGSYPDRVKDGNTEIYSLRDANGKSFATIELQKNPEGNLNSVTQIKGSNNKVPIEKYRPFIMQWVLNNDLKIYGDIQGALLSPIFEEVLGPYESIDTFDNIRDIDLGLLTPYKKSFIDSKFNIDILLNNTDNEEFLLELIDNDRYTNFISKRLDISEVIQHKLLEKGDYDVLNNLASNPNLVSKFQYKLLVKGDYDILRNLASNPSLVPELQSIKGLFDYSIPISKEIQHKLLEKGDYDVLGNLALNPSLVSEIQYKLLENGDIDVLKNLASNSSLVPEIQSILLEKGNYDVLGNLSSNPSLVPEIQSRLLEKEDYDVLGNLSSNPNLAPEIQYKLLEKGKNYYLINLASNPNLLPEIQYKILEKGRNYYLINLASNPNLVPEIQNKLLENGDIDVLRILASNPNLLSELQSIRGLFDTNIPISKEIQYKLMENGDNNVLKTLASNPNLVSEIQYKLLEKWNDYILYDLASNLNLAPEIQYKLLEKGNNTILANLAKNPNLVSEIQYKLLEKGNDYIFGFLAKNTSLMPEIQSIRGLFDPEIPISEEIQYKLLENRDNYVLKNLSKNHSLVPEVQYKLLENVDYDVLKNLSSNPSLAPEVKEKLRNHKVLSKKNSWYKRSALFGTDPFGGSELSDKTKVSPFGAVGGDAHTGILEPSDENHHDNDYFSESNEPPSIEKALQKLKEKVKRKNRKTRLKKKRAAYFEGLSKKAQWGTEGPRMPTWGEDDWVSKTYKDIASNEDEGNTVEQKSHERIGNILNSTVMVEMLKGDRVETGSGFFINENIILTCAHVVVPADGIKGSSISVTTDDGKYNAYVWAYDSTSDVAAIVVNDVNFKNGIPLKLGNSSQVHIGDQILVVGSPLGFQNIVTQGIVSSEPSLNNINNSKTSYMFVSSNIYPGNSGGPIVDNESSAVIGIAAAVITPGEQAQNGLSATVPIDIVKPFLKNNGIKFQYQE